MRHVEAETTLRNPQQETSSNLPVRIALSIAEESTGLDDDESTQNPTDEPLQTRRPAQTNSAGEASTSQHERISYHELLHFGGDLKMVKNHRRAGSLVFFSMDGMAQQHEIPMMAREKAKPLASIFLSKDCHGAKSNGSCEKNLLFVVLNDS